jgi:hypothetical protein
LEREPITADSLTALLKMSIALIWPAFSEEGPFVRPE